VNFDAMALFTPRTGKHVEPLKEVDQILQHRDVVAKAAREAILLPEILRTPHDRWSEAKEAQPSSTSEVIHEIACIRQQLILSHSRRKAELSRLWTFSVCLQ
jgi:hypothetical protein